ncbi:MAG: hypothetical protein Q9163_004681 [Psora crenata]
MESVGSIDQEHSSPNSSEEVDSHHATPATKLSTLSPPEPHGSLNLGGRGIVRAKVPPAFDLTFTNASFSVKPQQGTSPSFGYQDPFVSGSSFASTSTQSSADVSKLSPVASAFTPASVLESPCSVEATGRSVLSLSVPKNDYRSANHIKPIFPSSAKASPSRPSPRSSSNDEMAAKLAPMSLPSKPASPCPGLGPTLADLGPFSCEDGTSRYLMIQVGTGTSIKQIEDYLNREKFPSLVHVFLSDLALHGTIYVKFTDIRDADKAFSNVQRHEASWAIQHMGPRHFVMKHQPQSLQHSKASIHEGQVLVSASYLGTLQHYDVARVGCNIKDMLQHFGEVMAFNVFLTEPCKATFRAEYYDVNSVEHALKNLEGRRVAMCALSISRYEPDLKGTQQAPTDITGPIIIGREDTGLDMALKDMTLTDYREANGFDTGRASRKFVGVLSRSAALYGALPQIHMPATEYHHQYGHHIALELLDKNVDHLYTRKTAKIGTHSNQKAMGG